MLPSFGAPSFAAKKAELRFVNATELPNAGLTLKLMDQSTQTPLPTPKSATHTFRSSDGQEKRVEMFSPHELWMNDQCLGIWSDDMGNALALAAVKYPLPAGFPQKEAASKEDYDLKVQELTAKEQSWTPELLSAWVAAFSNAKEAKIERVPKPPFNLRAPIQFRLEGSKSASMAWTFRLNKTASGQARASDQLFAVFISPNPEIVSESVIQTAYSQLLPSITISSMSAKQVVEPSRRFQVQGTASSEKAASSPEYMASRDQVRKSIQNLKEWWYVETDNYIILSDLTTKYRAMITELQTNFEQIRNAYEQFVPTSKEVTAVSVIRFPSTSEEYIAYVGPNMAWSGGVWIPSRKELVIRPIEWGGSKEQKETMLRAAYHEAFHQYIFYSLDMIQPAMWFNEGHACFFESAKFNGKSMFVEENKHLADALDEAIRKNSINFPEILKLNHQQFYAEQEERRTLNYAAAWGIVYYLRKYATKAPDSPYANVLEKYHASLIKDRDGEKATAEAFAGINPEVIQNDLVQFWSSRKLRATARQNQIFKDFTPSAKR